MFVMFVIIRATLWGGDPCATQNTAYSTSC